MTANSTTVALIALISTVPCGVGSAQQGACVSKRAGSVPAPFAAIVARERTLVCERLATRIPGVQVAVAVNGKLVWSEGFGYADAERKKPVTRETQFRIGSVSKPLTATAVALLYEQGKVDLDAPVQRYVPSFPDKGYPITTRQLAGHLAGIRHYKDQEFFLNRRFATVLDGLAIFQDDSLLFPPGTRFSYSSYGWNLVAAVVEGASGDDFLHYMSTHVFRPKSVSGPRQCTDTCRVAGSPADPSRTARQDELRRAPRVVDGHDAGARSSCAAKAGAGHVPLKRQSGVSALTRAESRVHPRTRRGRWIRIRSQVATHHGWDRDGVGPSCAATAAARPVPLKRQS